MTATVTEQALLAAVLAAPGDDLPRLIYADAIEEAGSAARAEFIRVCIEMAAIQREAPTLSPPRTAKLQEMAVRVRRLFDRSRELWNASRLNGAPHPWLCPIRGFKSTHNWLSSHDTPRVTVKHRREWVSFTFSRGFPNRAECSPKMFVSTDIIRRVRESHPVQEWGMVSTWPVVRRDGVAVWTEQREERDGFGLPPQLFRLLPTGPTCTLIRDAEVNWSSVFSVREYESKDAAMQALSDACLAWAKGAA